MEIVWSDLAREQLLDILNYVSEQFGSMTAAKTYNKIHSAVNLLKSFPRLGMRDPDLSELDLFSSTEVRRLLVNPNMIFYAEFDGIILILTILNVRQSPETIRKSVAVFLKTYQKRKARQ